MRVSSPLPHSSAACILGDDAAYYINAGIPPPASLLCSSSPASLQQAFQGSTSGGFFVLLSGTNLGAMYYPPNASSVAGDVIVLPPGYAASRLLLREEEDGVVVPMQHRPSRATASEVYATPSPHRRVVEPPSSTLGRPGATAAHRDPAGGAEQLLRVNWRHRALDAGVRSDVEEAAVERPADPHLRQLQGAPSSSISSSATSSLTRTMTSTLTSSMTPSMTATHSSTSGGFVGTPSSNPTQTPTPSLTSQAPTQFCGYNGIGPGCFWRPYVLLSAASVNIGALTTANPDGSVPLVFLNHTAAIFKMPQFEGSLVAQLEFASQSVVSIIPATTVSLAAGPPTITAVHPVNYGDDPCFLVNALYYDSARYFESPYRNETASDTAASYVYPSPPLPPADTAASLVASLNATGDAACLAFSLPGTGAYHGFLNQTAAYNATSACIRAAANVLLRITGTNFGRGITPTNVYIGTQNPTVYQSQLECTRQHTSDTEVICATAALWPGSAYLFVKTPAGTASFPLAPQCPCGLVAVNTPVTTSSPLLGLGWSCVAQPTGSYTAGGLAPLIAIQDYWKTNATEWMQIRFVNATSAGAPDFVKCPVPGVCLPGNECPVGSSSWMCTHCEDGWKHAYGANCQICTHKDFIDSYGLAALSAIGLTAAILGLIYTKAPDVFKTNDEENDAEEASRGKAVMARIANSTVAKILRRSNLMLVVPSFINYAQVLAAISNYGSTPRLPFVFSDYGIIPNILTSMHIFSDFGASLRIVQCALNVPLDAQEKLYMALPVLVALAPIPIVAVVYSLGAALVYISKWGKHGRHSFAQSVGVLWGKLKIVAAATLFMSCWISSFTLAPTFSAMANLSHCAPLAEGDYLIGNPETSCADPAVIALQKTTFIVGMFWLLLQPSLVFAVVFFLYLRHDSSNGDGSSSLAKALGLKATDSFFDTATVDKRGQTLHGFHMFRAHFLNSWSIVRTFFTCVLTALSLSYFRVTDPRSQNLLTLFVLLALWALHNTLQPFKRRLWNNVEAASILGQLAVSEFVLIPCASSGVDIFTSICLYTYHKL